MPSKHVPTCLCHSVLGKSRHATLLSISAVEAESKKKIAFFPCHRSSACVRRSTGLLPIMLACQEEEKGLLLSIQHGGGGQSTRNQRRKQPRLRVKNNLRSKDSAAPSNNWKTVQQYSSQEMEELSNVSLICDFTAQSFRLFDGVLWVTS